MNSLTAADRVDISYRQIDFWIRRDYIHGGLPGSGYQRDIMGVEFEVLRYMAALVKAGLAARTAASLARRLAAGEVVQFGPWELSPRTPAELEPKPEAA